MGKVVLKFDNDKEASPPDKGKLVVLKPRSETIIKLPKK
jgi:hypothetical protein